MASLPSVLSAVFVFPTSNRQIITCIVSGYVNVAGSELMSLLLHFQYHPVDVAQLFGYIQPPDLNVMFDVKRPRFDKRTSSANWDAVPGIGLLYWANAVH